MKNKINSLASRMNTAISFLSRHKNATLLIVVTLTAITLISGRVAAVTISDIPLDIQADMSNYDNGGLGTGSGNHNCEVGPTLIYQRHESWLSPVGQSYVDGNNAANPIVVTPGQPIGFQINNMTFICHYATQAQTSFVFNGTQGGSNPQDSGIQTYNGAPDNGGAGDKILGSCSRVVCTYLSDQSEYYYGTPSAGLSGVQLLPPAELPTTPGNAAGIEFGSTNPVTVDFQPSTRYWYPGFNGPPQFTGFFYTPPSDLSYHGPTSITISIPAVAANWFSEQQGQDPTDPDQWPIPGIPTGADEFICILAPQSWINLGQYVAFGFSSGCQTQTLTFPLWIQAPTPPPETISGVVNVNTGTGIQGVNGVTINTCGNGTTTTSTIGGVAGSYSFTVPGGNNFCVQTSNAPPNDTNLTLTPVGGQAYPGSSSCSTSYYQNQIADTTTAGQCNREIATGYNFLYNQYATITCSSFVGLPPIGSDNQVYDFTTGFQVSGNPLNNPSFSVNPDGLTLAGPLTAAAASYAPGGTTYQSPEYSIEAANSGIYTIIMTISGSNVAAPVNCPFPITIGYSPYLNVQGGDVSVGSGGFGTSQATCDSPHEPSPLSAGILAFNNGTGASPNYQGAGGNLAAISPDVIDGYVTSNGGNGYATNLPIGLSFANINTAKTTGYGGDFQYSSGCTSDYFSQAVDVNLTGVNLPGGATNINLSTIPTNAPYSAGCAPEGTAGIIYCLYNEPNNNPGNYVAISTTPFSSLNKKLVIFVKGNAVVESNINLFGDSRSVGQHYTNGVSSIPMFELVADGNIGVASNVTYIDGIYIAQPSSAAPFSDGFINTCTQNTGAVQTFSNLYGNCGSQLVVDGSFIANQVRLDRTDGDLQGITPAENFNYNPNSWVVNPLLGGSAPGPNSDAFLSIANLPPVL